MRHLLTHLHINKLKSSQPFHPIVRTPCSPSRYRCLRSLFASGSEATAKQHRTLDEVYHDSNTMQKYNHFIAAYSSWEWAFLKQCSRYRLPPQPPPQSPQPPPRPPPPTSPTSPTSPTCPTCPTCPTNPTAALQRYSATVPQLIYSDCDIT